MPELTQIRPHKNLELQRLQSSADDFHVSLCMRHLLEVIVLLIADEERDLFLHVRFEVGS